MTAVKVECKYSVIEAFPIQNLQVPPAHVKMTPIQAREWSGEIDRKFQRTKPSARSSFGWLTRMSGKKAM